MNAEPSKARWVIYGLAILLAVLHQDFWFWDSAYLVFGFLPVGLAYHAGYSIAAAVVWALAVKYAWPAELEALSEADLTEGTE